MVRLRKRGNSDGPGNRRERERSVKREIGTRRDGRKIENGGIDIQEAFVKDDELIWVEETKSVSAQRNHLGLGGAVMETVR